MNNELPTADNWPLTPGLWLLASTNSYVRNYQQNMQNKANFRKSQMNVSDCFTMNYEQKTLGQLGKTKPIQSQYKPNSNPIQSQYKPNSKPIQTQFKANTNPIQIQYKPKRTQNEPKSQKGRNEPNCLSNNELRTTNYER